MQAFDALAGHGVTVSMFHDLSSLPSLDDDYCFGRPKVYLTPREVARLTIVRSRLGDTRAERAGEAYGPARSKENSLPC